MPNRKRAHPATLAQTRLDLLAAIFVLSSAESSTTARRQQVIDGLKRVAEDWSRADAEGGETATEAHMRDTAQAFLRPVARLLQNLDAPTAITAPPPKSPKGD